MAAAAVGSPFDYPLSSRLDENDSILVFDKVFVPWENVFAYADVEAVGKPPIYRDEELDWTRDLTRLHDDWSDGGRLVRDEQAADFILAHAAETKGLTYAALASGPRRFQATDPEVWNSDVKPGQAYTPFQHQVEGKRPWRTLTGRQQFYQDHKWMLAFGEGLCVYRPPVDLKTTWVQGQKPKPFLEAESPSQPR